MRFRDDHSWPLFFKRTIAAQIHFIAFIGAFVGLVVFCLSPSIQGLHLVACVTFAALAAFLMAVSAVYHFASDGLEISEELEQSLEDLDHSAIYLFIAATYTPFLLNAISSSWKYPLLIFVWILALAGVLYIKYRPLLPAWTRSRFVYTGLYLMMGWIMLIRISEILQNLSAVKLALLGLGATAYSVGALIYAFKRPNFFPGYFGFHELWHIAVVFGIAFHFALVLSFY